MLRVPAPARIVIGLALMLGAYLLLVLALLFLVQFRNPRGPVAFGFPHYLRRGAVVFAIVGAAFVIAGMAMWLPAASRQLRPFRPLFLVFAAVLALPAVIPVGIVGSFVVNTVDTVSPLPPPRFPRFSSTCTTPSGDPCVFSSGRVEVERSWPVWAQLSFGLGVAMPFALLGWAWWASLRRAEPAR